MALHEATKLYFEKFNAHDAAAVRALFAEDGELRDWDITKKGGADIQEAVQGIFTAVPAIKCNILKLHGSAETNTVVAELKIDLNADGSSSILVADVLEFKDGKIQSLRAYKG